MTQQVISEQELAISSIHDAGGDTTDREAELVQSESVRSSLTSDLSGHASEGSWVR
jgi:hypothetical protein